MNEDMEKVYGLKGLVKSFAIDNEFTRILNKGCNMMGSNLKCFAMGCSPQQDKWGVTDLAEFNGFYDSSKSLFDEIVAYRRQVYSNVYSGLADTPAINVALFYDYLLSVSACYVEYARVVTKGNTTQKKYFKGIYTKNPAIMASWMGTSANEMQAKYGSKVSQLPSDFATSRVKVVCLDTSKGSNTIKVPREALDCSSITCVPLFMQYAFICGIWTRLEKGILKFTYLKDNDTERELCSTVNFEILRDYYDDKFIYHMLTGVDAFSVNQGGMQLSAKQSRGYVRLPELGCSKFDKSGVRALNICRLLGVEEIDSVPRTFINVNLDDVVPNFKVYVDKLLYSNSDMLYDMASALFNETVSPDDDSAVVVANRLTEYATSNEVILTTTFRRSLHMFMISNPQWFDNYTGEMFVGTNDEQARPKTQSVGITEEYMDF